MALLTMFWPFRNLRLPRQTKRPAKRLIDATVLEKRLLFSASPVGPPIEQPVEGDLAGTESVAFEMATSDPANTAAAEPVEDRDADQQLRRELVFVDAGILDYQQLIDEFSAASDTLEIEFYLLDADQDGISQISEILADYQDIDAIHILSHGNDGKLRVGNAVLDASNLDGYAGQLALWNSSLGDDADLLLYGCELAETSAGRTMIDAIAALTGADVTASTDDTGHQTLGGDWDLEYQTGSIESEWVDRVSTQMSWFGLLSTAEIDSSNEQLANTTTSNVQQLSDSHQSVAVDGLGNSIVVWVDFAVDGSGTAVMAQRFDSTGANLGVEFQVNANSFGNQSLPVVTADDTGRFAIAYISNDANGTGVFVRRYDANGTAIDSADILVNSGAEIGNQTDVSIASNHSNQIVMTWESNGSSEGIFARYFDFTSTTVGDALSTTLVSVDPSTTATRATVSINATGRMVVVWDDNNELYGQKYDFGSATSVAGKLDLNVVGGLDRDAAVAVMNNGDYVIAYRADTGGGLAGIWQRLVHDDDSFETAVRVSSTTAGVAPAISMDASGRYLITYGAADADGTGVYYQSFDSYASVVVAETLVNQSTALSQSNSSVAIHDIDNFVVVWSGNGDRADEVDSAGIFVRQFGTAGANTIPIADLTAGAPYSIAEGETLSLSGANSTDADGNALTFAWDLDNDGIYGESGEPTSETADVDWSTLIGFGIDDDGTYTIGLRVEDGQGGIATQTTTVTVTNTAPVVSASGTGNAAAGQLYTLNLVVTDSGDDTVTQWRVDWGDGTITTYAGNPSSVTHTYSIVGLTHNILVAATDEDGTWYAGDFFLGTGNSQPVRKYVASTGDFVMGIGNSATLNMAADILYGQDGLLYVAGRFSDNIQRFDPNTGSLIDVFVSAGSGGLEGATGIAFGPDGNLYVSSRSSHEVLRYDGTTGAFIDVFVSAQSGGVERPRELFFSPDGFLYVASEHSDNILRYNGLTGAFIDEFVTSGSGGLNGPTGFSFGPDGRLYVASQYSDEILRYDGATGAFIDEFVTTGLGGINGPYAARFGPDGLLYVSGFDGGNVLRYDLSGNFVDAFIPASGMTQLRAFSFSPAHQVVVTSIPNTIPLASNVNQIKNFVEDTATVSLDDIVVIDSDSGETISVTLTLDLPMTGILTTGTFGSSTSTYNAGTGVWSMSGSVADINAALADVSFLPSADNEIDSQITVHLEDSFGVGPSDGLIQLDVIPQNDAPTLDLDSNNSSGAMGSDFDVTFVEGGGPILIADATDAILVDRDNSTLSSLVVTVVNPLDGSDELLTADTSGTSIIAVYGGGTMSLSGTDTIENYQQVLRTVRYSNSSASPAPTARLVQVTANDGVANSNTATATITIVASNDAPMIDLDGDDSSGATGGDYTATYTEDAGPIAIVDIADVSLVDLDSPNLSSLTVMILNLANGTDEVLSADTTGTSITKGYTNGVLTLTGIDTVANYEQVLRTIQYTNTSDSPAVMDRLISFVANDGGSASPAVTASISIIATNDAPVLDLDANDSSGATGVNFNATFAEGGGAVLIVDSNDAVLSDPDSGNLTSMSVTITNLLGGLAETLSANTTGTSITANYFAGTLTLTGTDSVANYQQVLKSIRYNNFSLIPNTTTRVIEFVARDGALSSSVATASVTILAANDAPTLDLDANNSSGAWGANYRGTFTEGSGAVLIADPSDAVLNDADSATMDSLTATISNLRNGASESLSADTSGTNITAIYSNGTLTLSGTDSVENYQQVLQTIRYDNTAASPDTTVRLILVLADDGISSSNLARSRISIVAVNNAPTIAVPGNQTPTEDVPWSINGISVSDPDLGAGVLELSLDVSRGQLTLDTGIVGGVTVANVKGNGTTSLLVTGTIAQINTTLAAANGLVYVGNPNVWGSDLLTLSVDDSVNSTSQTVSITVQSGNDAPVAVGDRFLVPPNQTTIIKPNGLLANDFDIDGDTIWIDSYTQPSSGSLSVNSDGSLQFTPKESFSGLVTFSYVVTDGVQRSGLANVVIQVSLPIRPADIDSAQQDTKPDPETLPDVKVDDEPVSEESSPDPSNSGPMGFSEIVATQLPFGNGGVDSDLQNERLVVYSDQPATSSQQLLTDASILSSAISNAEHLDGSLRIASLQSELPDGFTYAEFDSALLWQDIESLQEEIGHSDVDPFVMAGTFAGFSSALSVGYVMWTVRGGLLATSLLAHLPAWSFVDPLLVLSELDDDDEEGEDDSLEEMLDKSDSPSHQPSIDETAEDSSVEVTTE